MRKAKKSINKSIFTSHLIIILIFMLLTAIIFDLALRIYVRRETRNQIITTGEILQKSINQNSTNLGLDKLQNLQVNERGNSRLNSILKRANSILDIKYIVINEDKNIIYPNENINQEDKDTSSELIAKIKKNQISNISRGVVINLNIRGNKYQAVSYPIKLQNNSCYLIVYSDLSKSDEVTRKVNLLLFSILIIMAIISLSISTKLAKKISNPIYDVIKYAKNIAERDYTVKEFNFEHEELTDLSRTMSFMATKLSSYDNTMKTFMQNASHELRTPLMSIQGYAEGIRLNVVEDKNKAIEIIIEESKRLSTLVEDLLYLSKIDAMQDDFNLEKVDMKELISSSIDRIKGITIKNEREILFTHCDEELFLYCDEEKLMRAIINILANCIRYSNKIIDISLEKKDEAIVIDINDDGSGFDKEDKEHIFDRFFKGKGGNYGLGLAITKTIIQKHSGIITADNNIRGGANFNIILPLQKRNT
ncbi:HAMP domain-containing sensor histidine kinase [Clostridium folliculivorans]|uniref:histidine kinase n=1 Tax=Clostridium folliculivorans TaxID=2886038 RepID=A0A9W5Y3F7_9CLOT|nr:HAMP domain-containing sensor histidine kinase [Clostridium folliculivorans]GKU25946.1 two-component sensor histidine kinase [Clostridium folliculivorans]GKU28032.1 two-component sensor histidine kinase [Clostridium folliculivorans]